jgi:hypothetical protein
MAMRLKYQTPRDPNATHQVVIFKRGAIAGKQRGDQIHVSCNCMRIEEGHGQSHASMGVVSNLDESRALYNDPSNHMEVFTEEDEARW